MWNGLMTGNFSKLSVGEDIKSEVYYLVDWVPTLVQDLRLRKAQAQPLIDSVSTPEREEGEAKETTPQAILERHMWHSKENIEGSGHEKFLNHLTIWSTIVA